MKHLIKTVSFIAVMSAIPGAFAATQRASVIGKTTSRLPSIAGYVNPVAIVTGTATGSSSAASLLTNADCIDAYKSCINGSDACGADFEECTTNVLFHAQMPKCLSVLSQCTASGINDLFGTSSVTALSNVAEKNTYGEVTRYTYPTDGSVLGQMILGAAIANKYDTQQCVKRYTSCLKKDNVCGNDFELCTTAKEFKKQSVFCASTLARCQSDGLIELFGSTNTSTAPKSDSRIGMMINDGAELAAANAVSTCYKVADQCILNACGTNPAKCMAETSTALANMVEAINSGSVVSADQLAEWSGNISSGDVNKYIRNMCQETIGGNKYCYMTSNGGKMPKASDLTDEDNREMVFGDIYASRMNSAMKQRLQTLLEKFDEKTKDKCVNTMKACAMRSCGGGVGSVCYSMVFKNGKGSINGPSTYDEIKLGCEAITNTDASCQYALASTNNTAYLYTYSDNNTFTTLFPEEEAGTDPIGIVALLNASLSTSYNEAAIANMKKQCATTAVSCVKSMCGKDYANCYRNRTDVYSNTYDTGSSSFDKSMNKMGGVLDYTIVTGLCVNTVKNSKVCEEHLKIESVKLNKRKSDILRLYNKSSGSWGSDSVRNDWLGAAGSVSVTETTDSLVMGCQTSTTTDECKNNNSVEDCGYVDENGCVYDEERRQDWTTYVIDQSATNLFQEVLADIEKEAQAKYKAKLTKEQNKCLGNNNGGIMGASDNGSTFAWVKLKSAKVPKNYPQKGLNTNQFVNSNDVYGSFCRAKISVVSDDQAINEKLGEKATAYFAVGDAFECGSWIDTETLKSIEKEVRNNAKGMAGWKEKTALAWSTVGGMLAGGTAGGLLGNYLANGQLGGGGLLNSDAKVQANTNTNAGSCVNNLQKCLDRNGGSSCRAGYSDARAADLVSGSFEPKWLSTNGGQAALKCGTDVQPNGCNWNGQWFNQGAQVQSSPVLLCGATTAKLNACYYGGQWYGQYQDISGTGSDSSETLTADGRRELEDVLDKCRERVKNNKSSGTATGLGIATGATVGGVLGFGIAKTVIDAKNAQAKDKAVAEWKAAMGEHIRCYLGSEDLAGYGDYVSFNFDE